MTKHEEYAIKLRNHLAEIFDEDNENHISIQDVLKDNNATAFLYALGVHCPQAMYASISKNPTDPLDMLSILTRCAFEICKPDLKESEE